MNGPTQGAGSETLGEQQESEERLFTTPAARQTPPRTGPGSVCHQAAPLRCFLPGVGSADHNEGLQSLSGAGFWSPPTRQARF